MMNNMTVRASGMVNSLVALGAVLALQVNGWSAPVYSPAPDGYAVSGSDVTGSGTNLTSAYFLDPATKRYTIVIKQGSDLENTTAQGNSNELEFSSGTVTNHGTLLGTNDGIVAAGNLTVINSGSITGTDQAAVRASADTTAVNAQRNAFTLVNTGSLFSTTGDGFDAFSSNVDALGTGINSNVINVTNSGTINVGEGGLNFDNDNESGGGISLNSLKINNSGSITSDFGIDVDDFFNEESVGAAINVIAIKNSGTIASTTDNYIAAENETSALGKNTLTINNSGTVTSTNSEGFDIDLENDENTGDGFNKFSFVNTGTMTTSGAGVDFEVINNSDTGSAYTTIYLKNAGTITSTGGYGFLDDDDDYNYENGGNATISVTVLNTGTINGEAGGIYLEPYNEDDLGKGVTHVYVKNTGTIISSNDNAYENGDGGNYDEAGTGTNTAVFINTGSITGGDDAVDSYIYNGDNGGNNSMTGYTLNSGSITATSGEGAYFYYENYDNAGNGVNHLVYINTATGVISAPEEAADFEGENYNDTGTGLDKNDMFFSNAGTVVSSAGTGALVLAENYHDGGNTINVVKVLNTGLIQGNEEGLDAEVSSTNAAGNVASTLYVVNSGVIAGGTQSGVDLENNDAGTVGTAKSTIRFYNAPTGVAAGAVDGVYVTNNVSSPNYTSSVINTGLITGGTNGIEMDTDYGTVLTLGGVVAGGTDAIVLDGANSSVTIQGRTLVDGVIEGSGNAGNVLNFDLIGVTPAQRAAAKAAIAAAGGGAGTFTAGGNTYSFDGFDTVNLHAASFGESVDSGLQDLASKIDANPLSPAFDAVYAQGFLDAEATLNNLTGREFLNEVRQVGLSNSTAMSELADNRAFQLRSGASGLDLSGLNVNPASMIASLGDTQNFLGKIGSAGAFGGTTMSDSKDEKTMTSSAEAPRWGAWASGTVTFADESGASDNPGYHSTSGSPTVGADYRVCPDVVVGALFNYTTGYVGFDDGSSLNTDSELGAIYADWTHDHWFVNGLAGYGHTGYDQDRRALDGTHATASPDGDEVLATVNGGYDFKVSGWTVSPEVGLQYTRLTKDSFSESGAGAFNLNVGDENIDSLRTKLGFHASHTFTCDGIKVTPQLNAAWYHECLDDTNGVNNSLAGAPELGSFEVQTTPQGRDFALVGAGLMATPAKWHDSVSFFLNYDEQVGQTDFVAHTVDGGVRVNF